MTQRDRLSAAAGSPQPESLLAAIVESSDDAILSKNLDGTITSWNTAASRMFGYTARDIIGTSVLRLIPGELQDEEQAIIARLSRGERIEHFETTRLGRTGDRIEVSLTISPIRDGNGKVVGASKIVRDIAERRMMERLLIQTEKMVVTGRMAATIAHEINNPLEAVVNLIYLARMDPSVSGEVREHLELAEQEIERVSLIARQTLGYFRESTQATNVQLAHVLDEVLSVYRSKLSQGCITVQRDFHPTSPVMTRKGEMTQVFANLLSNAIDAMPDGGELVVSVSTQSLGTHAGVRVQFQDGGSGIPAHQLEKIFEPFFTTKEQRGTGIGLWISRQLVESHGGTIGVTSATEPGEHGTCFSIFMPFKNSFRGEERSASMQRSNA